MDGITEAATASSPVVAKPPDGNWLSMREHAVSATIAAARASHGSWWRGIGIKAARARPARGRTPRPPGSSATRAAIGVGLERGAVGRDVHDQFAPHRGYHPRSIPPS